MEITETIDGEGYRCREFRVASPDNSLGRTVYGALWDNPEITGTPLILFGHGASGDRHQAPIPYLAKRAVREYGYRALAIDGPVHGQRKTGDGARGAFAEEWQREACTDDMMADWQAAIAAGIALTGAEKLGYWGLSMGTIFGLPLVATESRIEVAVLGLMGNVGPTPAAKQRIEASAASITCPVLFLMQLEDELFARDRYLALFDLFASKDKRIHAHPGLHPEVPVDELETSLAFLHRHFSGEIRQPEPGTVFRVSE
ncbi:MAG: alpha/beta hydrolase [Pseudomonadales bacterium]|nr:alpha/beta hydrolase [Pseudomonadales bacterium]